MSEKNFSLWSLVMPRCKGRCSDDTRCFFLALEGNYGFCGHHRGRKVSKPEKKAKEAKGNVRKMIKGDPFDYPASFWIGLGLKVGTVLDHGGKARQLKKDCNDRMFWGAPVV